MDTSHQLSQLARIYRRIAHQILTLRTMDRQTLTGEKEEEFTNLERSLRDYAARLSLSSAIHLGQEVTVELEVLSSQTSKLSDRVKQLESLDKALKLAGFLVGLGAGILIADIDEIKKNITGITSEISG